MVSTMQDNMSRRLPTIPSTRNGLDISTNVDLFSNNETESGLFNNNETETASASANTRDHSVSPISSDQKAHSSMSFRIGGGSRGGGKKGKGFVRLSRVVKMAGLFNKRRPSHDHDTEDRSRSEPLTRRISGTAHSDKGNTDTGPVHVKTKRQTIAMMESNHSFVSNSSADKPRRASIESADSWANPAAAGGSKKLSWSENVPLNPTIQDIQNKVQQGGEGGPRRDSLARVGSRSMTRRSRQTIRASNSKVGLLKQLVNEKTRNAPRSKSTFEIIEEPLPNVILRSLEGKSSLCDVELIGKDEVPVQAPKFLLAVHSEVFEGMLYPSKKSAPETSEEKGGEGSESGLQWFEYDAGSEEGSEGGDDDTEPSNSNIEIKVAIPFADYDAIEASMKFLATRSLPDFLETDANEFIIRSICQIHLIGRAYKIHCLTNHAYRMARRILNKMPKLVCAAFDECLMNAELVPEGYHLSSSSHDELKEYVLDYMRDEPQETLLAGGTVYLNDKAIEEVICDHDMDVDEHTMFHILNTWVKQDEENIDVGKKLVSNIKLSFIKTDYLNNAVRKCGFVELSAVQEALRDIEERLANQSPDEMEHVLVSGAGNNEINGTYVRMCEDIGLEDEEVMYVKEAPEDEYGPDYGLYLLRSTWSITTCIDYSNILYTCEASENASTLRHVPPKCGWTAVNCAEPAPLCTWSKKKEERRYSTSSHRSGGSKGYIAPNLADGGNNKNVLSSKILENGDHDEGKRKRYTLRTMLNLPTDEDYEDADYHDDVSGTDR